MKHLVEVDLEPLLPVALFGGLSQNDPARRADRQRRKGMASIRGAMHSPSHWIVLRDSLFCGVLAALVLLPLSPAVQRFPFRDSGVFLYAGWRLDEGEVPYAQAWDHKPPLIYFINAAGLALGGVSVWGVWALEWVSLSVACLLAFRLLNKTFDLWAAGAALILMLGAFSILILGGNFATEYALPFQFACLALLAGMHEDRADPLRAFGIGVSAACLFLLKQNLIGLPAVVAVFRLAALWRKNQKGSLLPEAGSAALGAALVILPVLAYFAAHSALADLWDAAFRFNMFYAETSTGTVLKSLIHGLESVSQAGFGVLGLAGWVAGIWLLSRKSEIFRLRNAWLAAVFTALPLEFLLAALPGRFEIHYYLSVLPAVCVFACLALWGLFRGTSFHESLPRTRFAAAGVLAILLLSTSATAILTRIGSYRTNDWSDVASFVESNSAPSDTVLFWGAEAGLNFSTRRRSPTKYPYLYPLYYPGYVREEDISSFFSALQADPPLWVVDTKNPMTPFLEIPADSQAAFREWFYANYSLTDEIHGWAFYRFNGFTGMRAHTRRVGAWPPSMKSTVSGSGMYSIQIPPTSSSPSQPTAAPHFTPNRLLNRE
jgi:hypothetical protein